MHSRSDLDEGERTSRRGHSSHSHSLQPDEDEDERRHSVRLASPPAVISLIFKGYTYMMRAF